MRISNIKLTRPYTSFISFKSKNIKSTKNDNAVNLKNEIEILDLCREDLQQIIKKAPKEDVMKYTGFSQMREVKKEYEIINKILNDTPGVNYPEDAHIIADYIERMLRLSKDKGFNRISGYDDIKQYLYEEFILKVMAKEKTSLGADVPNAFLFYGPTGCGKTLFAKALAEQTLSDVKIVKSSTGNDEEETFNTIMQYAQEAKQNYTDSGDEKQRTIIILNEAEFLLYEGSPILDRFKEFLSNCAQEYKCTVFLTSNYPLDIDESILSSKITPYKLFVRQPNRNDAAKIIRKRLEVQQRPYLAEDRLVDKLFVRKDEFFSNAQLESIVDNVEYVSKKPELKDYLKTIEDFGIVPAIKKEDIERFEELGQFFEEYFD